MSTDMPIYVAPTPVRANTKLPINIFAEAGMEEHYFSTEEASFFFERSTQWVYWMLREEHARNADGTPLRPMRVGTNGRRRFTMSNITDFADSAFKRGNLSEPEMHRALERIVYVRRGLRLTEVADAVPWPKDKLAGLMRAKDVTSLKDIPTLKRQMLMKYPDLMAELKRRETEKAAGHRSADD